MTDGLGMLDEQRQRRARSIPTPKHPPRSKPVALVEVSHPESIEGEVTAQAAKVARPPKTAPAAVEPTVKMSIYLEPSDDLYLEEITHAGKTSRPRVAISRSAIVRLALEQLAKTMTTEQIVSELRGRGSTQGKGRKRR